MEFEVVVKASHVAAIAASHERLYVSDGHNTNIFTCGSFEQERTAPIGARQLVCDQDAEYVAVLHGKTAKLYSEDFRRVLYTFDSGSASIIAAHGGVTVLVSKRRLRWVRREGDRWIDDSIAISGINAVCIRGDLVYVAIGAQVLVIDLMARLVRELPIKLPTGWTVSAPFLCYSDALLIVSGSHGWYNQTEFTLKGVPICITSLGDFWLAGYNSRVDVYYGSTVVTTLETDVCTMSEDGFIATSRGVAQLKPKITVDFIEKIFKNHPDFALSLANGLNNPKIDELRLERAQCLLSAQQWDKGISLLKQANAKPEKVISELETFVDGIEEPDVGSSSPHIVSAGDRLEIPLIDALVPYLTLERRRLNIETALGEVKNTGDTATRRQLIDTMLFRCYYLSKSPLIGPLVRTDNFCDKEFVIPRLRRLGQWRDLVGYFRTRKMHTNALETLIDKGTPADIVSYLDAVQSWDLVKRFGPSALQRDPSLAEVLFAESVYDSHDVYEFLVEIKSDYTLKYLKKQVNAAPDDPSIHQDLAIYYLDNNMLEDLNEFLSSDKAYKPHEILSRIPKKLHHTRIILFSRMGEYKKVIEIYISHNEVEAAQSYCSETYESDPCLGQKALEYLYSHIVKRTPNQMTDFLNSQGHRLDPNRVLADLSGDEKLHDLSSFFTNQSRELLKKVKLTSIKKALSQAALSDSTYDLTQLQASSVIINNSTICAHCKKRLGLGTIGVWKGTALHYGCIDVFRSIY